MVAETLLSLRQYNYIFITIEVYTAPKVGTIVMGLLNRQFFGICALQHGNAHVVVAGVR